MRSRTMKQHRSSVVGVVGVVAATLLAAASAGLPVARADSGALEPAPVTFSVTDPHARSVEREIHGFRVDPPCAATSVVLLQHGLSYGAEAWDFSPEEGYSYARTLAAAGYTVVAIDRLGYGASTLDDGYRATVDVHADIAHQIVQQLRGEFDHVAIGGHSAGAEVSELEAGLFDDVDALIAMGYHQFPSTRFLADFATGDIPRALLSDYEYFLGTPSHRAAMFYTAAAEPWVVAADTAAANLTPSGEILTITLQPSRVLAPFVRVPVLLQLADGDRLFPSAFAHLAAASFIQSPSVTLDLVPQAGHTYMLHRSGPAAGERIADWLRGRPETPSCLP
ncbi:alpha/beta hydrolase [Sorangium sp. So ce1182]|uniref:alpha/beta hydrolase n=1 Tax=Sorangium sp. So ce1182 TaxID=3133334 RepID=UPI003F622C6B